MCKEVILRPYIYILRFRDALNRKYLGLVMDINMVMRNDYMCICMDMTIDINVVPANGPTIGAAIACTIETLTFIKRIKQTKILKMADENPSFIIGIDILAWHCLNSSACLSFYRVANAPCSSTI